VASELNDEKASSAGARSPLDDVARQLVAADSELAVDIVAVLHQLRMIGEGTGMGLRLGAFQKSLRVALALLRSAEARCEEYS
jgi:hypothetical protein